MKVWFLTDPALLSRERASVEGVAAEGWFCPDRWHISEGRLTLDGVISAHDADYAVRLVYPDQFPLVPAWVVPQDPKARWSDHQYGQGGVLCLELRPDNWDSSATGSDVLRSAYNLLHAENPLGTTGPKGTVPGGEHIGALQRYGYIPYAVFVRVGCMQRIVDATAKDVQAVRWAPAGKAWPIMVWDALDDEGGAHPPAPDVLRCTILDVHIVRHEPLSENPANRGELGAVLGLDFGDQASGGLLVLVVSDAGIVPYHSADLDSVHKRSLVVLQEDDGARSGRASPRLSQRVAIVGLGSVGSKVAEILLRAGYSQMVLTDGDVMLPGNLERHSLDWRDVGALKVEAIRHRLLAIDSAADIVALPENLNWQRSARRQATVTDKLARCDLIVDATGDAGTSLFLGAIARANNRSFLSIEVLEGGLGCIIMRSVPERDRPFTHVRGALLAYCDEADVTPPVSGVRPYEAFDAEGEVVVADDAAVSVAAAHAARTGIDILRGEINEESSPILLVGMAPGWLFERHGHVIEILVPPEPESATLEEPTAEELKEAMEFTHGLLPKESDEAAPSS